MKVTYYGHACFGLAIERAQLLFDPFITPNPLAKGISLDSVPADFILISHGHEDHLADAAALATRTGATVIANYEVTQWLAQKGISRVHALNVGGGYCFEFGRVKMTPALHSSGLPDGSYGGNPGGFIVESAEGNFYYSGDTALTQEMKLIGETVRLKFAALCIGDNFTMGIDDAVKAAEFIRCSEILGVHYDTFPAIRIDQGAAVQKFQAAHKRLHLLLVGESHQV